MGRIFERGIFRRNRSTAPEVSIAPTSPRPHWLDLRSLQFQLSLSLATLIALGLSGAALWTTYKVQQILIDSHKDSIVDIGDRIAEDVKLYEQMEMMPLEESLQRALENRASQKLLLWVQQENGTLIAAAPHASDAVWARLNSPHTLAAMFENALPPRIFSLKDQDFVACNSPLRVGTQFKGDLFIAQDITEDQQRFEAVVHTQVATTLSAILLMTLGMIYYLSRSLKPLQDICRMTQNICAEDLEQSQLPIQRAPTEIQQLADMFNLMISRLSGSWKQEQRASARQRQFVSNVSHELRTPLTVVRGYLQSTLRRGDNLSAGQREALSIAATEADHTIQVLQDLLDLARADDGYIPYRMDYVILNDLVQQVLNRVKKVKPRPLLLEASDDLITAYTDESRLKQVLVNLVDNALKYSPDPEPVTVKLSQSENQAIIEVSDRGSGIPPDLQRRIFERFYRIDEARTRSGGTGLGLSIVKTFVEGMQGQVFLTSTVGKGSTFTVQLPRLSKHDPQGTG
ncbi:sensor histidine kinase [Lyngbya confervoides]|uniref:histidine kinase n=1 Tax=Lyngbya confervoides BDU141951 TaxID=1574623 RepID=A0ABD4T6K6_9CYAN|nr:HAMP domain-containing sensor histidine kinase [Lyngbya confervoides]MCM1984088.1 HAMP domain-containing histidine kinase [Lyngbya confervoides BDU141951]